MLLGMPFAEGKPPGTGTIDMSKTSRSTVFVPSTLRTASLLKQVLLQSLNLLLLLLRRYVLKKLLLYQLDVLLLLLQYTQKGHQLRQFIFAVFLFTIGFKLTHSLQVKVNNA